MDEFMLIARRCLPAPREFDGVDYYAGELPRPTLGMVGDMIVWTGPADQANSSAIAQAILRVQQSAS